MTSRMRSLVAVALLAGSARVFTAAEPARPLKVFVIAGDENCLEQAAVAGRTDGKDVTFLPSVTPAQDERTRHVTCAVYRGVFAPGTDFDALTPETTGLVAIGEQPARRQTALPAAFPASALQDGFTTVLRGALVVPVSGRHEVVPAGCHVTWVNGREVSRREPGQAEATVTPIELEGKKRHAFTTVFFGKPETGFRVPRIERSEALETVLAKGDRYAFLRDEAGRWTSRDDVVLFDAHPIHNETRAPGRPIGVPDDPQAAVGLPLMLGHVLGDHVEEPVFLVRFATRHPIWFQRGSRSLGHDYLPPSSGGDPDQAGGWDVIHFNFGVWDATYRDANSPYFSGHNITSVEDFEKNLRTLVAKLMQTGATLIWATVTPVWEGEPGRRNADENAFNAVAEKVMREHGVVIDDLNAEVRRQGLPKSNNVHDVGNLTPKVTKTILEAIAGRERNTTPLPRVLLIGDSITGSYLGGVTKNLDGKAAVFKNPGNAEDTWNGLERIDQWLELREYLQSGQEYRELVNGVKDAVAQLPRFCPGYRNQGAEIAGLFWIHGVADSGSPAQAAAYEMNLANLIRDLRKEFNAPRLPVVIAALKMGTGTVHAAQLALADPGKHPDCAGTVAVVDTQPFFRDGDPRTLGGQAETVLEVGNALARAMLRLAAEKPGQ